LTALLVALAALAALALAERPSWRRATLLGVLLGLGGAAKLTPMLVSLPLAAIGGVLLLHGMPWRSEDPAARRGQDLGWMLLTVPLVAFAAFVAAYPYLWPDPIGRTRTLIAFREREMDNQSSLWDEVAVNGLPEAVAKSVHWLGEKRTLSGLFGTAVDDRFGPIWNLPWLDLALGAAGLAVLALLAVAHGLRSRQALALAVLGGQAAVIWVGMRADFDRYHLPILVGLVVGLGAAAGYGWEAARYLRVRWAERRARRGSRAMPAPAGRRVAVAIPGLGGAAAFPTVGARSRRSLGIGAGPAAMTAAVLAVTVAVGAMVVQGWSELRGRRRR
jgi:hypothetical protein